MYVRFFDNRKIGLINRPAAHADGPDPKIKRGARCGFVGPGSGAREKFGKKTRVHEKLAGRGLPVAGDVIRGRVNDNDQALPAVVGPGTTARPAAFGGMGWAMRGGAAADESKSF